MMYRGGAGLRRTAVALAVGASLALAACGDDDESSSSDSGSGDTSASAAPQKVTITATGTEKAPQLEVTGTAKPGAAIIEIQNDLDKGGVDGQMAFIAEEHSDAEIAAEFAKAVRGKTVADWFEGAGGPGAAAKPGETSSVTQELKAGTYAVLPGEAAKPPLAKFEVEGEEGPAFEPPAATVIATEYAFEGQGVKSGEPVLLDNAGGTWHHFLASRLKPDAKIAQVKKFLLTEKGDPPFAEDENAVESTVLDGGFSQTVDFEGPPGRYAFFCFIADKQGGGPPHVVKGMVSEVVVE